MIVGTAGHIDHGKTSLVRALTGVDTDRLKEEKDRGISIELGFAYMPVEGVETIGFVDVPGHEKFIHTMLAGAGGIDFVLLVVAADDGVMPQTREHLAIVDLLGIRHGVIAITKADLVTDARVAAVEQAMRNHLAETALADATIIPVSSISGEGVATVRDEILDVARRFTQRQANGCFRMAIDRSFTIQGVGTVVTGTVLSGQVSVEDYIVVSPSGLKARVRSIHAQNSQSETGRAGDRCALNLVGPAITKAAVGRGDVICDPGLYAPTDRIDATLRVLGSEPKPIGHWFPVRLHHASVEVGARIVLLAEQAVSPGTRARVQLVLDRPIAAAAGDRYVVRDTSARRTIGGGRFLDLRAPARKRRTPERMAQLDALCLSEVRQTIEALLAIPPFFIDIGAFGRDRAIAAAEAQALARSLGVIELPSDAARLVMSLQSWEKLRGDILARLTVFHAENPDLLGMGVERLRTALPLRLPAPAFRAALQALVASVEIVVDGAWVRLVEHQVTMGPADERLWRQIEPLLGGSERFRPPRVRDIAVLLAIPEVQARRLLKLGSRMGRVHEVAHDHFFLRQVVAEMIAITAEIGAVADQGWFTAMQFRDRLENGRKVAIQILDFFDRHSVTFRRGDLRRLNRSRLDFFGNLPNAVPGVPLVRSDARGGDASPVGRPDFKFDRGRTSPS
ncbi:selenocysteine-specific translation elongation factor [Ensifer sesbaniae]|uniref:selenocysteine-specific translation elongation factor n=1 Tax=Ensifer sesbaniae TaxID=1214071 RepID=UPI00156870B9|nr:selenocysteine-specific translation elongation factor [Ensifer sesbaniae]NRQ17330.1 Selenocysteine-specific elongation factor [Ensifer sesbaniae]